MLFQFNDCRQRNKKVRKYVYWHKNNQVVTKRKQNIILYIIFDTEQNKNSKALYNNMFFYIFVVRTRRGLYVEEGEKLCRTSTA